MTYAPTRLLEARAYLKPRTGLSDVALGIVGGRGHDGGYHCGWDRRRIRNGQLADYSFQESSRDSGHRTDAASALDIGNFSRLRELSMWLVDQCRAGAPDCRDIREIIYSPDGRIVLRWDRLGIRSTGDLSHLTHTHISYHRDAEHRDKVLPFRRFFEGKREMTPEELLSARVDLTNGDGTLHSTGQIVGHPSVSVNLALAGAVASHYGILRVLTPAVALLTERIESLTEMVVQLATRPAVPLTDEQLAVLLERVSAAAREPDPELHSVLTSVGEELVRLGGDEL